MATATQSYLTLPQAARLMPSTKGDRPVHPITVGKWITRGARSGKRRVYLEGRRFPGGWKVTPEAIERFVDELTRAALESRGVEPSPSKTRQKELDRAAAECASLRL
jgi:hypothetical protein